VALDDSPEQPSWRPHENLVMARWYCRQHHDSFLPLKDDAGLSPFCDLPQVRPGPVRKFLLTQMAGAAGLPGLIGQRTRAALAAAKARGERALRL